MTPLKSDMLKKPDYVLKLGKDGKLTPEEHQQCLMNKLCLFCGGSGHITSDCQKRAAAHTKAQAANSELDPKSETLKGESKNQ